MTDTSPDPAPKLTNHQQIGKVFLVGAGPGHPGLITVRGLECLTRADSILYDYLANPLVLSHASEQAERICLGRHRRSDVWSQEAINHELVRRARAGQQVVRLKGGDPMVFGRVSEEISALIEAQIPFEIVPGVTTASAAAAFTGITITDREHASAVALVTGHEQLGKPDSTLDYRALADFPGTLVIYMGVRTVADWSQSLIAAGKPGDTPVMLVRRASWPDQEKIETTLSQVAEQLTPYQKFPPPVVAIIGETARAKTDYDWYGRLPLMGTSVLVTRPAHQAAAMVSRLSELGAHALLGPAIFIDAPHDWTPVDTAIQQLASYQHLVFSSSNGVHFFMQRLFALGCDVRRLAPLKLAAIGPRTKQALREYSLLADIQPDEYRAEALAEALVTTAANQRFLLVRASRGREVLAETLTEHGGEVHQIVVYRSEDVKQPDPEIEKQWPEIDWVTVTSSAIARSLHKQWGTRLQAAKLASISPITTRTLNECGLQASAEAEVYTADGVIDAILKATSSSQVEHRDG